MPPPSKSYLFALQIVFLLLAPLTKTPGKPPNPRLENLSYSNPALIQLRKEIAQNLQSTTRTGNLEIPLRFVRYRVRKGDEFFKIMARVSQNADTLSSLNEIIHPNALTPGQELLIPNARGIFSKSKKPPPSKNPRPVAPALVSAKRFFHAGGRLEREEREYFRGNGFLTPLRGRISSRFGKRRDPFSRRLVFHGGVDIAAAQGSPVLAAREGQVVAAGRRGGYGKLLVVRHRFGYQTYYGHLSKMLVKKGERVRAGQRIGLVGRTGRATGPHLHFEVRKKGVRQKPKLVHGWLASR